MGMRVHGNTGLARYDDHVRQGARALVVKYAAKIDDTAKENAPYRSGTLRRSIGFTIIDDGYKALIGSRGGVPYARIQDLGGKTRAHIIRARPRADGRPGYLFWAGAQHPVREVNHPGSNIPGNRYLTGAFDFWVDEFGSELRRLLGGHS